MKSSPLEVLSIEINKFNIKGWIVVDSINNGMAFGGCRFDPSVTREIVEGLAQCMTWKLAAHGLPVGGAKGGLAVDPSHPHIKEILKEFALQAAPLLKTRVIIGKDLGASNEMLDCIYSALSIPQMHIAQQHTPQKVIPNRLRDMNGYIPHMTGLGVAIAAKTALNDRIDGRRVLIQGFGAVGAGVAVRLGAMGCTIVGVSDASKGIYNRDGLPVEGLMRSVRNGRLSESADLGFPHQEIERDALLGCEADILVLAATSNCIDEKLAKTICSPIIVEGANFPILAGARDELFKRGVLVVPDVLANSSSGAMVAHQMASGNSFSTDDLWQRITGSIQSGVRSSMEAALSHQTDLRQAYINWVVPELLKNRLHAA